MFHQKTKQCPSHSAYLISSVIPEFTYLDTDLVRDRRFPADKPITFLVSQSSSSTKNGLLDSFGIDLQPPTASTFNQQRAKLNPNALGAVFRHLSHFTPFYDQKKLRCRFLVIDGSTFTFFSKLAFAPEEYHVSEGHSIRGFYSTHLNTFYDSQKHTHSNALIQPIHQKDEFGAFCEMVDRHDLLTGTKGVFIDDRGYCSYNNTAHVEKRGQYFLFHIKDIHSKGFVGNLEFSDADSLDIRVNVTSVRSHKKKISVKEGYYKRFMDAVALFDYIAYGSLNTYGLFFRIVRFPISDDSHEYIVTNLPSDGFPSEQIKLLYHARQAIEGSFRKLKYTVGLSNLHAYKPEYTRQEIWAKLIAYNITETRINHAVIEKGNTKYEYKVNFSMAVHTCRVFLRPNTGKDSINVMSLLTKELIPMRNDRQHPRLQTAHFRKPRYFIYRTA